MAEYAGVTDDVALNIMVPLGQILQEIGNDPALIQLLSTNVRNEIVGPMARRMGNTAGKTAQRKTPLASKPQPPGTQRVW